MAVDSQPPTSGDSKGGWWQQQHVWIPATVVGAFTFVLMVAAIGVIAGGSNKTENLATQPSSLTTTTAAEPTTTTNAPPTTNVPTTTVLPSPPSPPATKAEPSLTVSQENARRKAQSYLDYTAFSKSGLIEQLGFEGFSKADASFAVDSLDVDWKQQAAEKAKDYLEYSSFSRSGLIEQLKFEGFSAAEAEYGVKQTGL